MDYSNLTNVELTAAITTFDNVRSALQSDAANLPADFAEMFVEFMTMTGEEQDALLADMRAESGIRGYAATLGNPDIAPALKQVAKDMAGMTPKELKSVATGGMAKLSALK